MISLGFFGLRSSTDPDFGLHLKTGELILEKGAPYKDWYSYTMPDFPWIDHEWLADVLIYKIHSISGADLLLLIFLSIHALSFFVVGNRSQKLWIFTIIFIFGYLATVNFLGIRLQIITVFFVAVLWKTINDFLSRSSRSAYFLPLMFILWTNLHAGFFAGLVILFIELLAEIFKKIYPHTITRDKKAGTSHRSFGVGVNNLYFEEQPWKKISALFFILLFSFLATIINPYGLMIYEEVFRTIGDNFLRFNIVEWFPLFSLGFHMFISLYIAVFAVLLAVFYRKVEFNQIIVSLFFFSLAMASARHFLLFVIITIPVLSEILNETALYIKSNLPKTLKSLNFSQKRELVLELALVFIFLTYGFFHNFLPDFFGDSWADDYPEKAIPFLKTLPQEDNLFNEYRWGGYLIWKIPERKYFIDGRMPSWRQNGQFAFGDYLKIYDAEEGFEKIMEKYDIKMAALSRTIKDNPMENRNNKIKNFIKKYRLLNYVFRNSMDEEKNLYKELTNLGWQTIYEDDTAIILKK